MGSSKAEKIARAASKRHQRNKSIRSAVKTEIAKAEKLILAGEVEASRTAVNDAVKSLDKAAEKKILHGNNTARRKSRLLKKLGRIKEKPQADSGVEEAS